MFKGIIILSIIAIICGSTASNGIVRYAKQTDSPWLVLLEIGANRCGGSLIKDKYILTAAHCFDELEEKSQYLTDLKIYIGEWKTNQDPDCGDDDDCCDMVVTIKPKKVVIHKNYQNENKETKSSFDIALITLTRPPRKSEIIQNINLPNKNTCDEELTGRLLFTGFGEILPNVYTTMTKKTTVFLENRKTCLRDFARQFNSDVHICGIGPNGITTCKGDSGSGVSNIIDNERTLQGIVLFGSSNCGRLNVTSGFLKVSCFIDWIEEQISGVQQPVVSITTNTGLGRVTTPANESDSSEED